MRSGAHAGGGRTPVRASVQREERAVGTHLSPTGTQVHVRALEVSTKQHRAEQHGLGRRTGRVGDEKRKTRKKMIFLLSPLKAAFMPANISAPKGSSSKSQRHQLSSVGDAY